MKNKYECCETSSDKDGAYMRCACEYEGKLEREKNPANAIIVTVILLIAVIGLTMLFNGVFFK